MNKKVLVITTSLRKNSNSERLADAFLEGAKENGNLVEKIRVANKNIGFCKGCLACQKTGKCVIEDDMYEICEKMKNADIIAFATPIYYYEMSGQLKTLLDRTNPLYSSDYAFRDIYFLSTAAENSDSTNSKAMSGLGGWVDCFPKAKIVGSVFAGGVNAPDEIEGHPSLQKAYEMGKLIR